MLSWAQVEARLKKIQKGFEMIERMTDKMVAENPFVTDGCGVPAAWLCNLIEEHFVTLCLAINPSLSSKEIDDFMNYYIWESNFGGVIESNGKDYDLSKTSEFVAYIQSEMGCKG